MDIFQATEDYSVLFEDTSYPDGYSPPLMVPQKYVILCKEDKKKWIWTSTCGPCVHMDIWVTISSMHHVEQTWKQYNKHYLG